MRACGMKCFEQVGHIAALLTKKVGNVRVVNWHQKKTSIAGDGEDFGGGEGYQTRAPSDLGNRRYLHWVVSAITQTKRNFCCRYDAQKTQNGYEAVPDQPTEKMIDMHEANSILESGDSIWRLRSQDNGKYSVALSFWSAWMVIE